MNITKIDKQIIIDLGNNDFKCHTWNVYLLES